MRVRTTLFSFLLGLLGLLALAPSSWGAGAAELVRRPSHRFAVQKPDPSWVVNDAPGEAPGSIQVTLADPARGGEVLVSVLATPAPDEVTDAADLRDRSLRTIDGQERYRNLRRITLPVGERDAPALAVHARLAAGTLHVEAAYVLEGGFGYVIQTGAPPDEYDRHRATFQAFRDSFRVLADTQAEDPEQRLRELAARCGSELAWAGTFEEAAARARRERKLVLVYARMYGGFQMKDEALGSVFTDPSLVSVVRERFVPYRLRKEDRTPLHDPAVYGLSDTSFGSSVIVTTPDGEVVGETFAIEPPEILALLADCLKQRPEFDGRPPGARADALALATGAAGAALCIDRGDFDRALALLAADDRAPRELLAHLEGRIHLLTGDAEAALAAFDHARGERAPRDLDLDRAAALAMLGRIGDARDAAAAYAGDPKAPRRGEALLLLGSLRWLAEGREAARDTLLPLTRSDPEDTVAWRAAAILTGTSFEVDLPARQGRIEIAAPGAAVREAARPRPFAPLPPQKAADAARDAIRYLVEHQRDDGSWICPAEVTSIVAPVDQDLTIAITAIAARALLPHGDDPGARRAVDRAVPFLRRASDRRRERGARAVFMDYGIYADAYTARFAADAADAGRFGQDGARAWIDELVRRLKDKQKPGGGFSYYLSGDPDSTEPSNQSIGFVTGAVTLALLRAAEFGASVPEESLDAALGCLERMKNENGTYEYFLFHDREDAPRNTGRPGAAGRGPVMTLALLRGGRASIDDLREALDIYVEHQDELAREAGKALMHCGRQGQGSHYVMFNYATTAQAIAALPERDRPPYRDALLESMLERRTDDGAFADNPMIGRAYGAAMALVALDALGVRAARFGG